VTYTLFTTDDRAALLEALSLLRQIRKMERMIGMTLDDLIDQVSTEGTVISSAITLLNGLHQQILDLAAQIAASGQDATKITALASAIGAQTQALADAVAANTPAV
jgi:hypothetical protein